MRSFDGYATTKICTLDLLECVFEDPMYDVLGARIAPLIATERGAHTRREWVTGPPRDHEVPLLVRFWVSTRLYASAPELSKTADKRAVFDMLNRAIEHSGGRLPYCLPSADQLKDFKKALSTPWIVRELIVVFLEVALARDIELGGFSTNPSANLLSSDDRSSVHGDGTRVRRYSEVKSVRDPETGEVVHVGGRPRSSRSRILQTPHEDGPLWPPTGNADLNIVRFFTRTPWGRIHLVTTGTYGAESLAAMFLLDLLLARLDGRVRRVIYDTALTGWMLKYLMAEYGALAVTWPVKADANSSLAEQYRLEVRDALHRRGIDPALEPALVEHLVQRRLERHPDDLIAQGRSKRVSPTSNRVSWVDSTPTPFRTLPRTGSGCPGHELCVEDSEMWEVAERNRSNINLRPVQCSAASVIGNRSGGHQLRLDLSLECPAGRHEFTEFWCPPRTRGPTTAATQRQAALDLYNPINPHTTYWPAYFRRSDAEAAQHEMKKLLGPGGRAASVTPEVQLLDAFAVDCLTNTRTWYAYRLAHL